MLFIIGKLLCHSRGFLVIGQEKNTQISHFLGQILSDVIHSYRRLVFGPGNIRKFLFLRGLIWFDGIQEMAQI